MENEEWIYILNLPNKKIYHLHTYIVMLLFRYPYYHSYPKSNSFKKHTLFKINTSCVENEFSEFNKN